MQLAVLVLNLIASLASTIWAVLALFSPGLQSRSVRVGGGELFYARMYTARAIPLGIAAGILPFCLGRPGAASIVFVAAAVQLADIAIAIDKKERGMAIGASLGAIVHIVCGTVIV